MFRCVDSFALDLGLCRNSFDGIERRHQRAIPQKDRYNLDRQMSPTTTPADIMDTSSDSKVLLRSNSYTEGAREDKLYDSNFAFRLDWNRYSCWCTIAKARKLGECNIWRAHSCLRLPYSKFFSPKCHPEKKRWSFQCCICGPKYAHPL